MFLVRIEAPQSAIDEIKKQISGFCKHTQERTVRGKNGSEAIVELRYEVSQERTAHSIIGTAINYKARMGTYGVRP